MRSQREQKGRVALVAHVPFGIEPGTWKHKATLPQPRWGMNVLGLGSFWCAFWVVDWDRQSCSLSPGAPGELCSPHKIRFMDAMRLSLFNLVLIFREELECTASVFSNAWTAP